MRIPRKSGKKPVGRACEAFPFPGGTLHAVDEGSTKSLQGDGKSKMAATYGKTRWNGSPIVDRSSKP